MPRRRRAGGRRAAFAVYLFVAGLVLTSAAWVAADALKRLPFLRPPSPFLEWAELFRHPDDASLTQYVASAAAAFCWGLFLYLRLRPPAFRVVRSLRRTVVARSAPLLAAVAGVQVLVTAPVLPRGVRGALAAGSILALLVRPVSRVPSWHVPALFSALSRRASRALTVLWIGGTLALLVAMSVEPVRLALGPVRLLNEYPSLPERRVPGAEPGAVRPASSTVESHCEFAYADPFEYAFQSMSRGQLNHIGHVINPLNEHATGKPLRDTYFQYGVGATFAFGWVMDLFGGPSLQAYYRSLLVFAVYALLYVVAALALLRDARYVLAAAAFLAVSHYGLGYRALLIAPGINPLLHVLDLPILLVLLRFFRTGGGAQLAVAIVGAAAAFALNPLFGGIAALALLVSAATYLLENAPPGMRAWRAVAVAAALVGALGYVALFLPRTAGGGIASHALLGFFSWQPALALVLLTFAYLAGSYLFLLWSRDLRDPLKYATVYLFVYAQGWLLYFYWSGLESHFWPALPYLGLHLLLMLRLLARSRPGARWEGPVLVGVVLALVALAKPAIEDFVAERNTISKLFTRWETHAWPFPRARVVSTVDPAPIAASLAQIERYSGTEARGICMVSVFDNLLPFLAGRHSIFPHFDLQWAILTEQDRHRMLDVVTSVRPRYVFVGREVEEPDPGPPEPCGIGMDEEERSARGRVLELRRLLDGFLDDYERIETGPLLSVYRRRGVEDASKESAR